MLAISRIAPIACTRATANAALRTPSSTAKSRSINTFWFRTCCTPGWPAIASSNFWCCSGSSSLTMNDDGKASWPANSLNSGNFFTASS